MEGRKGKEDRKEDQQTDKYNIPSLQPKMSRFKFRILGSTEHGCTRELVPNPHPFFLPTSVSVLHLMASHRYAYRHPCSTSKWSLLVPRGAYSSGATCPKEDIPGKGAMQALRAGSRPSEQGILGSRNSQCDLSGEGVVLLPWTPPPVENEGLQNMRHPGPGLRVTLHKQVAYLRLENQIKHFLILAV